MQFKLTFAITILLLLLGSTAFSQVVWTEPVFPKVGDEVVVFFDATQGTGGLADCSCDVYLHTGVILDLNGTPSGWMNVQTTWGVANDDWKMEPVPGQPNVYSYTIGPSITDYYNVQVDQTVIELAFVFRNATGSLEGKDVGGVDIFYPVYPDDLPFSTLLLSPGQSNLVVDLGEEISIWGASSETASFQLFDNGDLVDQFDGLTYTYDLPISSGGIHTVELLIDNGVEQSSHSFSYVVPNALPPADPPAGAKMGANLQGDTAMILLLYAPNKENIFVLGSFNDYQLDLDYQMRQSLDGESWWIEIGDLTPGEHLTYQYLVDGDLKIADPLSTLVLDQSNDPFIPEETYPDLPDFPGDLTSGRVSLMQPGAPQYEWAVTDFQAPPKERLTVYELLVRDFIERHDYTTLIDTLDYLQNLGINAIELMPVQEFEGNISWGYNPSFHMALDKYYGPINEFKRFIDSCHARGMAVILDVVYNHAFGQCPLVQLYFDGKPTPESPYFNVDATHPFNVGYDFNHESEATRRYIDQVMTYWLEEFRVDGFRFDLSKGFTQVNNPDDVGAWGQYDASRIAILKHYADVMWTINPEAYVILEHFAVNQEEEELADYGMMVWGNMHGPYTSSAQGFTSNLSQVSYKARGFSTPSIVHYMESHDEERIMYSCLQSGNTNNPFHNVKELETALRRIELNSAFFYTVPGPKMLWQFGEQGYDINIDFNGRTGPKPILWDYLDDPNRRRLTDVTGALIQLRNEYEVFHTDDFSIGLSSGAPYNRVKRVNLRHADLNAVALGNFYVFDEEIDPAFEHTGTWYEYFSGDSLEVTDVHAPVPLTPGEYRLYTDQKLPAPPMGYITTTDVTVPDGPVADLRILPNPASSEAWVGIELEQAAEVTVRLYGINGSLLTELAPATLPAGPQSIALPVPELPGAYLVAVQVDGRILYRKMMVSR